MNKELRVFFTGLMFYTRIPVPNSTGFSEDNLNKGTGYFPFIGIIVGAVGAAIFSLSNILLPVEISIIISFVSMVLLTGAFHEDAISDFCDGFGGGYGKEMILSIMKDSRIGTYGAVALILLFFSKFFILTEVNTAKIPLLLIAAHAFSRLNPVFLIFSSRYVSSNDTAKSKPIGKKASYARLFIAIAFGVLPLIFLSWVFMPFVFFVEFMLLFLFRAYIHKQIGGYTGDVLGALQQISEVVFYLTFLIFSSYTENMEFPDLLSF